MFKAVLHTLAALLFPPSPEQRRVAALTEKELMLRLHPRRTSHAIALFSYADPDIRALILRAKYHRDDRAIELLSSALASYLRITESTDRVLIPVPLSKERFRDRGCNQVTAVLKQARAPAPELVLHEDLLVRTKHTARQTDLARHERITNVAGAFAVTHTPKEKAPALLLIDDVLTTGATLHAAKEALEASGFDNVSCVVLAH